MPLAEAQYPICRFGLSFRSEAWKFLILQDMEVTG